MALEIYQMPNIHANVKSDFVRVIDAHSAFATEANVQRAMTDAERTALRVAMRANAA